VALVQPASTAQPLTDVHAGQTEAPPEEER
jgi:hypothetical protein